MPRIRTVALMAAPHCGGGPRYFEKLPNSPYLAERSDVIAGRLHSVVLP
jgi:hypothetical protein